MHWTLVGIAAVITVILFIAVIMCIIITYVLAKGVRFMNHHFSASETDRANGEHGMMVHHTQQQEEQNEGTCTANSRHSSNSILVYSIFYNHVVYVYLQCIKSTHNAYLIHFQVLSSQ